MSDTDAAERDEAPVVAAPYPTPYDVPETSRERTAQLRVPAWEAVRRHWLTVLVPTVLLLAVGIYVGLARSPEYASEARLTVGRVDVDPASLATFASATQALASAYSRAVEAQSVVNPVARRLHLTPDEVRSHTSASPVPESPVIRVQGTGRTRRSAVALAAATSDALVSYTTTLNRTSEDSSRLLAQYRALSEKVSREQRRVDSLGRNDPRSKALVGAQARLATGMLQARSLGSAFQASEQGRGSSKLVGVLTEATKASSDRMQKLQILGLAGALAGLLVGTALATLRAGGRARRSLLG